MLNFGFFVRVCGGPSIPKTLEYRYRLTSNTVAGVFNTVFTVSPGLWVPLKMLNLSRNGLPLMLLKTKSCDLKTNRTTLET